MYFLKSFTALTIWDFNAEGLKNRFFKSLFRPLIVHKSIYEKYVSSLLICITQNPKFIKIGKGYLHVSWLADTYVLTKQKVFKKKAILTRWLSRTYADMAITVWSILILASYARFLGEVSGYYTNYANAAFVKRIMRTGFIWGWFLCCQRRRRRHRLGRLLVPAR